MDGCVCICWQTGNMQQTVATLDQIATMARTKEPFGHMGELFVPPTERLISFPFRPAPSVLSVRLICEAKQRRKRSKHWQDAQVQGVCCLCGTVCFRGVQHQQKKKSAFQGTHKTCSSATEMEITDTNFLFRCCGVEGYLKNDIDALPGHDPDHQQASVVRSTREAVLRRDVVVRVTRGGMRRRTKGTRGLGRFIGEYLFFCCFFLATRSKLPVQEKDKGCVLQRSIEKWNWK